MHHLTFLSLRAIRNQRNDGRKLLLLEETSTWIML